MAMWLTSTATDAVVVRLDEAAAVDADRVGTKAANLARARRAGLPTVDGFVLPAPAAGAIAAAGKPSEPVLAAYLELSDGGARAVVVRSSSPSEDTAASSMAGRFQSFVGVVGVDAFVVALAAVVASGHGEPMAVLVQEHLDPQVSGVLFGVDPVSGRTDRTVAVAVVGGPQALVAGAVTGDRYELDRRGRLLDLQRGDGGTSLGWPERRALTRLAARSAEVFGGPQDIEWARTVSGSLLLLQSRPITSSGEPPVGPVYASGPLAETFPAALSTLEQDLWLLPLRDAIREVAVLTGKASRRHAAARPIVVSPGGRPAVDADLLGEPRTGLLALIDPRPRVRRLRSAARVGRLSAALPSIVRDLLADTDAALAAVPALDRLDDEGLRSILRRSDAVLRSLHGHELLAGAMSGHDGGPTAAEVALHALQAGRAAGLADAALRSAHPEVLVLSAPRVGPGVALPPSAPAVRPVTVDDLGPREALRMRVRWVHELSARAALELGRRLQVRGRLDGDVDVRQLHLEELLTGVVVDQQPRPEESTPPLPAHFRLSASGDVVAVSSADVPDGVGAGGGRRAGPVHIGDDPPPGSVLVVDVLDPGLAVHLPNLAAVVAETGSPLSHLAILAREQGVATVVGLPGARSRWTMGQVVIVDGTTGMVEPLEEAS